MNELVTNVGLLCLDAGNTVIFLDHHRLSEIFRDATGVAIDARTLVVAEGEAKRRAESGDLHDVDWAFRSRPGAASWGKMIATVALAGGLAPSSLAGVLEHTWPLHEKRNLWCKVPAGLGPALDDVRARGVKVAIISNSEGKLDGLFRDLGIRDHFDLIVDSALVGVEKPDPRIFGFAVEQLAIGPERALHLGDFYATDILGARAAGIRCALIDPYDHYAGRHLDVPRVPGVVAVARAMV